MSGGVRHAVVSALLMLGAGVAWPEIAVAQAETAKQAYNIPAGSLDSVLRQFSAQSRVQLIYASELVDGKKSTGLSGSYTTAEALRQLLRSSGLESERVNDKTVVLRRGAASPKAPATGAPEKPASANARDKGVQELEEIVVTGSHIRRTEIEGPSPVLVINREDLDRSGRSTVGDVLGQLPQNFASPISTGLSTTGTQAINLRGLGVDNTLVLVNGHRVASSGASGNAPFFDLNSIPLAAVERVEVLTDGASALYGSDAVTGVVNIILKENFRGSEVSARYGASKEGGADERQMSFTTGWSKAGFNVLLSGEYFKRHRLAATDRSFSRTDDLRSQGGQDLRLPFSNPGNIFSLDGENLPGLGAPFAAVPVGQDGRNLTTGDFVATAGQLNLDSFVAETFDLVPESERYGLSARLNGEITPRLKVFAEAGVSRNKTRAGQAPAIYVAVVPETNAFNPFGESVLAYWAAELPASGQFQSDNQRALIGLEGWLGQDWAWETDIGYSRDKFDNRLGPFSTFGPIVDELLASSDPATALNVFGDGVGANSQEVLAKIGFGRSVLNGVNDVLTVTGKADGTLSEWAGREVRVAVGGEYREEGFESKISNFQIDPLVPSSSTSVAGDRKVVAGFFEMNVPLFDPEHDVTGMRLLELQLAARFEHYSDFGVTANPKFALRWQPVEFLTFRGSIGTSFRAPSLRELFAATSPSISSTTDPRRNSEPVTVDVIGGGNPNLEPEKSRSWNLGFIWDASFLPGLSLTTDLWSLNQKQRISTLSVDELVAAENIFPERITRADPTPEDIEAGLPGRLLAIDVTSLNASEVKLRGVDVGINYRTDSAFGRFDLRLNGTYMAHATRKLTPITPTEELVGTLSGAFVGEDADLPAAKRRANLSLFWTRDALSAGITERYIGRTLDPFSTLHPVVRDQYETDFQMNYTWPDESSWLAGTRLSFGAENVFNKAPPFRDNYLGYASALHNPRQAFYYLQLTKAF